MMLYPTETLYALGVNALDSREVKQLFALKQREDKNVSWLVRDMQDVARWGEISGVAAAVAEQFLPGPLTLVVPARESVPKWVRSELNSVSFRISPDAVAQKVIADFMETHDAPLTCTSANISGQVAQATPQEILRQFGERAVDISKIVDDGPRTGVGSTVVRIFGDEVDVVREGAIPAAEIVVVAKNAVR